MAGAGAGDAATERPGATRAFVLVSAAVLLATSPWLSGTAVAPELSRAWGLGPEGAASLTLAVQVGFLLGTFVYAATSLADVFSPRRVFAASALLAAASNLAFAFAGEVGLALALRLLTGLFLAGVYPVAMKIMATWFDRGLGFRLGVLVGALTAGTSLPYLLRAVGTGVDHRLLVSAASGLAAVGGLLVLGGVPDGPHLGSRARFDARVMARVFRDRPFRLTAFGYFGHMWELYAFWGSVSGWLGARMGATPGGEALVPWLAFAAIGVGALGCALGGWASRRVGERRVASVSLAASGAACLLSPVFFALPEALLVPFLLVWGFFVVADSPQFSALAARYAPREYVGTALTVQNGVGFGITLASIQLVPWVASQGAWSWALVVLAPGPLLGLLALARLGASTPDE